MPHKPGFIHTGKDETSWNYFELPFGSGADYKKPIALENLPYTPAILGEMLENKEKEREVDIEGLGKGRLVISKQNKNKPFFYPDQSEEYTAKKSRQLQIGEIAGNLPLITSPLTTLGKGVPKIIKTKSETPRRLMAMSMKESSSEGAINLKKGIDNAYNMPTQQSASYYKRAANVAKKNHISLTDAFKYLDSIQKGVRPDKPIKPGNITGFTYKGLLKDTDVDDPTVYIPPEERLGTQKGDPLEARFQYQGSFDFGPNGEIYWNKIDPAGREAWRFWLELTAQKSGYMSMKEMIKVMREWPEADYQKFMHELWDGFTLEGQQINRFNYTGYAEHKKAKASKKGRLAKIEKEHPDWTPEQKAAELARKSFKTTDMDWLHDTEWIDHTGTLRTDGIGLGDRNDPKNMLALFDSQWKSLKDISEQIGNGTEAAPGPLVSFSDGTWRKPKQRFYIDVEDPGKKRKQYLRNNPGDIVIKRADNHKIIGNIGSYLRALYPMDKGQEAQMAYFVAKSINPETGQFFTSLKEFRAHIIKERINIILRDTDKLPSNPTKRKKFIKEAIEADMVELKDKYGFLKSIPTTTEAEIAEDFATWRGEKSQKEAYKSRSDIKKSTDINIGGSKAGGTVKENKENIIQRTFDELFGRKDDG